MLPVSPCLSCLVCSMAISTAPNSKDYCEDRKKKKKPSAPNTIREQKHELLLWASLTYFSHMSLHYFAAHLQVIRVIHVMLFSFSNVFSGCIQGHQKSGLFAFFIHFYSLWAIARSHTALPCFLASAHPFFPLLLPIHPFLQGYSKPSLSQVHGLALGI